MKRFLMAAVVLGVMAAGSAADAAHKHHGHRHYPRHHGYYRPARVHYCPPPVYAAPVVYQPYYVYPGNSFYLSGRNFSFGLGW